MKNQLTRPLVLRDESVRHPFRANLPRDFHVRARSEATAAVPAAPAKNSVVTNEDVALFSLSFLAFFVAISSFIA